MSVVCDINVLRGRQGLRPLRWDGRLWSAAQGMAADMADRHYFGHVTEDGRTLADRILPTGYLPSSPTWMLAENLGWGTRSLSSPLAIVLGWMDSPPHRENVLDPQLEDIGVGMAEGGPQGGGMVYVADFGTRGVTTTTTTRARRRGNRSHRHS